MKKTLEFPELLRLIDERSTAFHTVVASAPSLDVPVPSCPGWTLFDLAQHVGVGRRKAAAIVAAGPADAPPDKSAWDDGTGAPREREALLAWLTESIDLLASTLREAGPERGCWTWWGDSQSPQTSGGVARHQVQEVAMHTYDAQLTLGAPQPLPDEVAFDGVEEFLFTCCATDVAWPHEPAAVAYHAAEGRSLHLRLSPEGAQAVHVRTPDAGVDQDPPDGSVWGTASDLVLLFYGRIPLDSLKVDGDRRIFEQLIAWDPSA
ncbi:maleylpyruvate isomerase N-terminal domain-containing protein [Krasilnikovia sp. MM14-A1259]|uniref:maleylpyruvate isomerase N-terminal domain-containing protein n=1 Tax=Krasilnikovia sp. MM14-A1259 TaxID=3373539 RepID=UPI00381AFA48